MEWLRTRAYRILRWSEKYTKTDMVYAASGGFWLVSGQAIAAIAALALAVAFANLLEPEKYGNYKYVLSLAALISVFSLAGLTTALTRATARGYDGTLTRLSRMMFRYSLGMVVLAGVGGTYYLFQGNEFLGLSLLIIGAVSPIIAATSLYRPFLMGKGEFKRAALYGALQSGVPALAVLTALFLHTPLLVLVATYFTASTALLVLLYFRAKKVAKNDDHDPEAEHLGKHLSIMTVIAAAAGKLDSVLLFQFLGGTELAIFAFAVAIPDTLRGSLKHIATLAMPKFVGKTKEELKRAVYTKSILVFAGTTTLALAYVFAAPIIFQVLFPAYLKYVMYSQVYAVTLLFTLILSGTYFDAQKAIKERYILSIFSTFVTTITVVLGIYWFGLWGAIGARIITRILNVGAAAFMIARH